MIYSANLFVNIQGTIDSVRAFPSADEILTTVAVGRHLEALPIIYWPCLTTPFGVPDPVLRSRNSSF